MEEKTSDLTFGQAVEHLKKGKCIARRGWNGKDMYIYLNKGCFDFKTSQEQAGDGTLISIAGLAPHLFEEGDKGITTRLPNINMWTAQKTILTGWLASQSDILAEDWMIVNMDAVAGLN